MSDSYFFFKFRNSITSFYFTQKLLKFCLFHTKNINKSLSGQAIWEQNISIKATIERVIIWYILSKSKMNLFKRTKFIEYHTLNYIAVIFYVFLLERNVNSIFVGVTYIILFIITHTQKYEIVNKKCFIRNRGSNSVR